MIRAIWQGLVPGTQLIAWCWLLGALGQYMLDRPWWQLFYAVMSLLNWYSLDMQRRAGK